MKISPEVVENIIQNSPFWYADGWDTVCNFIIDPAAAGDPKGKFNRELSAWGYEKRYELDSEGNYVCE